MGIIEQLQERTSIEKMMNHLQMDQVYFDNLYWIDENDREVTILKLKRNGPLDTIFVEWEKGGIDISEPLNRCGLMNCTQIYLRLQKMIREFNEQNRQKTTCCQSSPECRNCPEKKSH